MRVGMESRTQVVVGVDVGGTNTDAAVMHADKLIGWSKQQTTDDVTSGVVNAIEGALINASGREWRQKLELCRVHIGTTHFVNAVVQKNSLAHVAVIRLCGPASTDLPPFSDFPEDLKQELCGGVFLVDGGFHFDGQKQITELRQRQIEDAVDDMKKNGVRNVVVSGVFSPINNEQEEKVGAWIAACYPEASVTLSHKVAQIGILLRENSAILNESLKPLAKTVISAFTRAFQDKKLECPFFLTQNDGTLLSASKAQEMPVLTFAAGPTNSMRGAAFLSGVRDGIVVDIGGTSTDVGAIVDGFPRPASTKVQVGGVQTNFQMPDTVSIGLGGGSKVTESTPNQVSVGPESVGYRLCKEAFVFGGSTLTATDIAVAAGHAQIGKTRDKVKDIRPEIVSQAMNKVHSLLENVVNSVKSRANEIPLILVGGGSDMIASDWGMAGISEVIKPEFYSVANAVGAARSQVSGNVDVLEKIETNTSLSAVKERVRQRAIQEAIQEGAKPGTVESYTVGRGIPGAVGASHTGKMLSATVKAFLHNAGNRFKFVLDCTADVYILSISEEPLTYLPGNVTRIIVKAVGDLALATSPSDQGTIQQKVQGAPTESLRGETLMEKTQQHEEHVKESPSGSSVQSKDHSPASPNVDSSTGEWLLSAYDVECLAVGAGILGCGGGGSPYFGKLRALQKLKEGKKIRVINPIRYEREAKAGDNAVGACHMGAPTVSQEIMFAKVESMTAIDALKKLYSYGGFEDGKLRNSEMRITALLSPEVAGSNSMEPLIAGAELDLPILDCDFMGRAFPEIQMCTAFIYGMNPYPCVLGDSSGRAAVCLFVDRPKTLENHFRGVCVEMGCTAAFAMAPLTPRQVTTKTVLYSISRAWRLGQAVLGARAAKSSPIDAILQHEGGVLFVTGKIIDLVRKTEGGFTKGQVTIEGSAEFDGRQFVVLFQNEHLIVKDLGKDPSTDTPKVVATVPDLITMVDLDSGEPISTDEMRYGLRVAVLGLPASPMLTSQRALEVVSPQAFGYSPEEALYTSVGHYVEHSPIPLT